jgi:hypothetical protein
MNTVKWNVAVSADTDQSLRLFLAEQSGGKKGNLSHVIEEAVKAYIFDQTIMRIKSANSTIREEDITAVADEALDWARNR